ncbi:hypothetical protein DSL72_008548 [Monilinia vaccinii-corymbosi]|uniref:Uncharacterized protein n=1 Tax=Monilinia vaccinii-corymbosi TaxID=61207 RepID=A0A8A3PPL7_9HELO|nr:hypothetical protein DSL72_008548 [Monilinia vaccinii-corymbosi]
MPQSLSSSMQGYHGSGKAEDEEAKPHIHPSANKPPRLPLSPSYSLKQFSSINEAPPLAFREPIPIAERTNAAKSAIIDFDGKMKKG